MKKKMLFMAALAGAVTLGSCVKDDVSSSVEAVRQAKAAQLNAEANRDNATAEHTRALQAADLALQQATAAAQAATAKAQELRNEVTAAALQQEIAKTIADYENQLATSKANAQTQLNNLAAAQRAAGTAKAGDVQKAVLAFNTALTAFTGAQKNVINDQLALAAAKNDAEHAAAIKENQINAQQKIIDENEKLIELLTELKGKVAEGATSEELNAEAQAVLTEANIAAQEFENNEAINALIEAGAAWVKAYGGLAAYTNPLAQKGKFAVINDYFVNGAGKAKVGMPLYNTYGTPVDIKAGDVNFGEVDGYTYAGGASYADGGSGDAKVSYDNYRLSEEAKLLVDKYVADFTKNDADALKDAKTAKADLEGALGKSTDTKDSKFKNSKGVEAVTLYGAMNEAKAQYDKKVAEEAAAKKAVADKPAALKKAIDALIAENDKKSPDAKEQLKLTIALAKAIEEVYGAADNRGSLPMDITTQANADAYVYGGTTGPSLITKSAVEDLFKKGSTFVTKTVDPAKEGVENALSVAGHTKGTSVVQDYEAAKAATKTAKTAYETAQKAVNDQPQKIAKAQDDINAAQYDVDNSEKNLADLKAQLASVDLANYEAAIKDAKAAADAFNAAAAAVKDAEGAVDDLYAESFALAAAALANPNDIDDQIKQAKEDIADAEQIIANWDNIPANNPDAIIAQAEADLADSTAKLAAAAADLAAAKDALESLVGDIDPADEPADEPAEGEGESEGEGE